MGVRLSLGSRAAPVGAARSRKQERGDVKQPKNRDPKNSTPRGSILGSIFLGSQKKVPLKDLDRQIRDQKKTVLTFVLATFSLFWMFLVVSEVWGGQNRVRHVQVHP